jgi:probable rRNA maturation factor
MKQIPVFFFKEQIKFRLSKQAEIRSWILRLIKKERYRLSNLNFIFCTDIYLRKINKAYLDHDYFTDIITFDNSDLLQTIDGDIYISIDRIKANSVTFKSSFEDELHRVMAHGVLHLLGYSDKNKKQQSEMKNQENKWLDERDF